jgi:hypothetical protein
MSCLKSLYLIGLQTTSRSSTRPYSEERSVNDFNWLVGKYHMEDGLISIAIIDQNFNDINILDPMMSISLLIDQPDEVDSTKPS